MRTLMATGLLGAAVALSSFPGASAQTLPVQAPSNPAPGPPSNPVKDQPAPPAPGCSFRPLSAGEVRVVDTEPNGPSWWWGQALAVDPWNPCQMYMTVGSTDGSKYPYALMRGTAQGTTTTWSQVFQMPTEPEEAGSSAVSLGARGLTPVPLVTRPGMAWLAGATMGPLTAPAYFFEAYGQSPPPALTRVFRTADSGSHWTENDNGLLVHSVRSGYTRLLAAPADPQTLYLLSINEHSNAMISVTHDGGQSWQLPAQLPAPDTANSEAWKVAPYAVDPGAAGRLFYLQMGPTQVGPSQPYSQTTNSAAQVLWESSDSGSTWTPHPSPGAFSGAVVDELFATHPAGRGPDVYAHVLSGNAPQSIGQWYRTRDLGTTWTALPLPQDGPACPAGSPVGDAQSNCNDSFRFLTYPGSLLVPARNDPNTLVWIGRSPASSLSGSLQVLATTDGFAGRPLVREQIAGPGFPSVESLQSDASGDFFLAAEFAAGSRVSDAIIAFRPPVQSGGSVTTGTAAPLGAPAPPPPPPPPTTGTPVPTKATCIVPSAVGGSVAFDGRFVDYTQTTAEPGVIRRFDAATCAIAPSLVLNPADFGSGSTPVLTALTYDALFRWQSGQQGAILGAGLPGTEPSVPAVRAPIYAVNPVTAAARLLTSVDTHTRTCDTAVVSNGCVRDYGCLNGNTDRTAATTPQACAVVSYFAYDIFRNRIWTVGQRPGEVGTDPTPGVLSPGGEFTPNTCGYQVGDPASLTVAGDGVLYWQAEDDQVLYRQNMDTCAIAGAYQHSSIGENPSEDEQIACDPVSGSSPVMWERNSAGGTVSSYPVPDAYCPFPTRLTSAGSTAGQMCFSLAAPLAGDWHTLQGQTVTVSVAGVEVGRGDTDQAGTACVAAAPGAGPWTARFSGTLAYLPSQLDGAGARGGPAPGNLIAGFLLSPPAGLLAPPQVLTQGSTASQAEASSGAQAQAQAESQAQAQSQAQSQAVSQVQPGVMAQRQRRTQVAMQHQGAATQTAYQATALMLGTLLLGFGVSVRRPGWAWARARRPSPRSARRRTSSRGS